MAIYHFHAGVISRKAGRSSVGASAYRAGDVRMDQRRGKVWDFSKKPVVYSQTMSLDDSLSMSPETLWNTVEALEKRKDSTVAKEYEISLPCEFDLARLISCAKDLAWQVMSFDQTCCEFAIHPPNKESSQNWHVHIMTPCREFADGQFGQRCLSTVSAKERKRRGYDGKSRFKDFSKLREYVANVLNEHLELAGLDERVDHRSFKDRGIDLEPTIHEGVEASAMRRRGLKTRIGEINDGIRERNMAKIREAQEEDDGPRLGM